MVCRLCKRELTDDEKAIYKRLVNRAARDEELTCKTCLAAKFGVPESVIDEKIAHFRSIGCMLVHGTNNTVICRIVRETPLQRRSGEYF